MTRLLIFALLMVATVVYAFWRGDRDSRLAAGVCVAALLLTQMVVHPVADRFGSVETGVVAVDIATLASFTVIALYSSRFWPLWVAGLQLTTSIGHLLKAIDWSLVPRAYAVATIFWSYPILIIIAVGAWRADRRRRAAGHPTA